MLTAFFKRLNAIHTITSALVRLALGTDDAENVDGQKYRRQHATRDMYKEEDAMSATSDSAESTAYWIEWFLSLKGNEFFCEIDEDYIMDRFNLTGLNTEVSSYSLAFDLITDALEEELDNESRTEVENAARHLYGLIHARFIITARGLAKMQEKYRHADFGRCPRVLCENQAVMPVGLTDNPKQKAVKLFCPRCEDVYSPPSRRHNGIDGAYFGTTFPHLFFQSYSNLVPQKLATRYVPKIFGFKIHQTAREQRKQDELRREQQRRLQGLENEE